MKRIHVLVVALLLSGCVPGLQAYWDAEVREMCEKDAGIKIFQQLRISKANVDLGLLGRAGDGKLGVPLKELAHPRSLAYAEVKTTYLREVAPQVRREEWTYIRREDGTLLAREIVYSRVGGDLPSPAHSSSFTCPNAAKRMSDMQRMFIVVEDAK